MKDLKLLFNNLEKALSQQRSTNRRVQYNGMDKEENIFNEMSDEETINQVSSCKTMIQEDDDDVIATTPQVTTQDTSFTNSSCSYHTQYDS